MPSVVVGSADALSSSGLRSLVRASANIVVAEARTVYQAASQAVTLHADVVVYDIGSQYRLALTLAEELKKRSSQVAVIVLTDRKLRTVRPGNGVLGWLDRNATTDAALGAAIQSVAEGLVVVHASLLEAVETGSPNEGAEDGFEETLTPREAEVLLLLSYGLANKQIAQRLSISEHTVKFHVSELMAKLGATTRTEAVTRAARRGVLTL